MIYEFTYEHKIRNLVVFEVDVQVQYEVINEFWPEIEKVLVSGINPDTFEREWIKPDMGLGLITHPYLLTDKMREELITFAMED